MNIEDRLRAELDRSGRSTKVGVAPSIDDLAIIANQRRHRNRVVGMSGAVVLFSSILFGAFFATQVDDPTTLEMADAAAEADVPDTDLPADAAGESDSAASVDPDSGDPTTGEADDADEEGSTAEPTDLEDEPPVSVPAIGPDVVEPNPEADNNGAETTGTDAIGGVSRSLQNDGREMAVVSRESAVELAGGSGVLVVPDGFGGYRGLATRFGDDSLAVGLESGNGLDWNEVELSGVPADATASVLREHAGTYVALFERFDADTGTKEFLIGTSIDMASWELSAPLEGSNIFVTELAVGSPGVIAIGDNLGPDVWVGPIGGPYERGERLDARSVFGVTTLDGEFLVAGRSSPGITLFTSTDGRAWHARELTSPGVAEADQTAKVDDGTVILTNVTDDGSATLISSDGGLTWSALDSPAGRGVSVSASTMGFLGSDGAGAVVAVADDATFTTARIDVAAPDRLSLVAVGTDELVMVRTTESGVTWIVASR
ncbi:MAG: hypothetical protein ACI81L_001369 [Verrucomicrobiales bacterium]|jgi:hypothetical protein